MTCPGRFSRVADAQGVAQMLSGFGLEWHTQVAEVMHSKVVLWMNAGSETTTTTTMKVTRYKLKEPCHSGCSVIAIA